MGLYEDVLSSSIDGHDVSMTKDDIAHALGCHPNGGVTDVPFPIPSDEESVLCSDMYGEVRWTQSVQSILRNMQHAHSAIMLRVEAHVVEPPFAP
ncbi:hypothetical protein MRB53_013749 [Persea americana]|uniref:Uncharacterized protein n=1 Tax=Persea americana TaxID=3435 RepID=A0ACC2K9H6_PERAE|nr:hypothetical protein MRB53_013749 [Persea americana]